MSDPSKDSAKDSNSPYATLSNPFATAQEQHFEVPGQIQSTPGLFEEIGRASCPQESYSHL